MNKNFVDGFEKKAVLGLLGKAALGIGKFGLNAVKSIGGPIVRNPMKSIGAGFIGTEIAGGAAQGANRAARKLNYLT